MTWGGFGVTWGDFGVALGHKWKAEFVKNSSPKKRGGQGLVEVKFVGPPKIGGPPFGAKYRRYSEISWNFRFLHFLEKVRFSKFRFPKKSDFSAPPKNLMQLY